MESPQSGFTDYFAALKRRRGLLLGIALPLALAAVLAAVVWPNIYVSSALIELDLNDGANNTAGKSPSDLIAVPGQPNYADQYVASLKETVLSDSNLRKLLEEHNLYPQLRAKDAGLAVQKLRNDIDVNIVTTQILDPRTGREREVVSAFAVSYDSREREKAQPVAAWLVDAFFAANRQHRQQAAANAAQFFAAEARRIGEQNNQLEAKLADFKRRNYGQLPELSGANLTLMDRTEHDIGDMEAQMRSLREQRVLLMTQLAQMRASNPESGNIRDLQTEYQRKLSQYDATHPDMVSLRRQIESLRQGGAAGTGASLQEQLSNARSVLAEARQRYSEDHPDVKRQTRVVAALEARVAAGENSSEASAERQTPAIVQLRSQLSAIDTELSSMQARSGELRGKLSVLQSRMVSAPQVEQEYQTVMRDLTIARAKYDELLKRQMDAEVSQAAIVGGRVDEFTLVKPPVEPTAAAKPQRLTIGVIGVIFALVLALTVTVAVEALDQTVRGNRDVRDLLAVAPLVAVPGIRNSVSRRRQARRVLAGAVSLVLGASMLYFAIQYWA